MQVKLNVSLSYVVDGILRTAEEGQVVTDLPQSDAMRLVQRGLAVLLDDTTPSEPQTPTPKRRGKRGA